MVVSQNPRRLMVNVGLPYRLIRAFFRFLTSIWFREVDLVDNEFIADDAGVLFISWHPNGLIDPMLLTATLPQRVTTLVSHRLFSFPLVRFPFQAAGVIPLNTTATPFLRGLSSPPASATLSMAADRLASGGCVLMFPEEHSHPKASVQTVRSGAARLFLEALRRAQANDQPRPRLVPVGLHYADASRFRERAAIVLERTVMVPDPPLSGDHEADKAWISDLTTAIEVELQRANLARSSWHERTLIWKARGVVQAEKQRQSGQALQPSSYAEAVLAARRLRAGWEYLAEHNPKITDGLVQDCEIHFAELNRRGLRSIDVDARPERLTLGQFARLVASWLWALVWMFGLVTWGALLGNYAPYKFQSLLENITRRAEVNDSLQGSIKVLSSVLLFPLWWGGLSAALVWVLLDASSPISMAMASHQVLVYVTMMPPVGAFVFFMFFWPLAARAHMKLYERLVRSYRRLKQWRHWQDADHDWERLSGTQRDLAKRLVALGGEMVLPGDVDWVDPPPGQDDVISVRLRNTPSVAEG
jgi:hypothetical protein